MKKHNEELIEIKLEKDKEKIVDLGNLYPLGKIIYQDELIIYASYEGKDYFPIHLNNHSFDNYNYRYLKLTSKVDQVIHIYMGLGYYAERNEKIENMFLSSFSWSGADGIYSFNLENEEEYNQFNDRTLFVFGDTFIGATNENKERIEPTGFVNNTFAYLKDNKIDFEIARNNKGAYISLFEPKKEMQENGYLAKNLTLYYGDVFIPGFISSQNEEKDIELVFDFYGIHNFKKIEIENFFDVITKGATSVDIGLQEFDLYYINEMNQEIYVSSYKLDFYSKEKPLNIIDCNFSSRYIKFKIKRERNINPYKYIGIKKVYFYDENGRLFDVKVNTNSEFSYFEEKPYSWFWLQDGVRVKDKFYIFPCIIEQDKNGIEGFEFKIKGVAKLKMDIVDFKVDYNSVKMEFAPFYRKEGLLEYIGPSAIMKEDDTLYFYCYYNEQDKFLRHLIVGRIKEDKIDDLNNIEYYTGHSWSKDMKDACSLIEHVSCEMSVQKIVEGENKNKYLAIFQYDTNSPKVSYSIGESPFGPFTKPRIVYITPEVSLYNKTTYTYNAKAHLHLSSPRKILVSYNCNDMSMKCNKADYTIYHPRFISLLDTSND